MKKLIGNIKGFTLTELVVTTAIMGTLAAVAVPSYLETNAKAKAEKTMVNINSMGAEVGKVFNDLAAIYGRVQLGTGATGTAVSVLNATQILTAGSRRSGTESEGFSWGPDANFDEEHQLFPGGVYKSPFNDADYQMQVLNPGSVSYDVDESGNVEVIVQKARLKIWDIEDVSNMSATFAY